MATRKIHTLTAVAVSKARKAGYYADGGGLYLQVAPTGAKTWIFRYSRQTPGGKTARPEMGLGGLNALTLAQARERAATCRNQVLNGMDPIAARKAGELAMRLEQAKTITFSAAAKSYIDSQKAGWKNAKHADQWTSTIETYANPVFGNLAVADISTDLVLRAIEPIWTAKNETASRLRGRIESVLDWAKSKGHRAGDNPAAWKGHLDAILPKPSKVQTVTHFPALPFAQMGDFMKALRQRDGIAARALEFCILTAVRSGEVRGATWAEIDMDAKIWTIPAARMKMKREHRVPLSDAAMAVLKGMKKVRHGEYVFPGARGNKPLSDMTLTAVLRRMERADITVHGFRSSFRDWASERTNFSREVAEMALAHSIGDAVEAAYRRGDLFEKRRNLMQAWTSYCDQATAEVISIGKAKARKAATR
jgi:integrase